jgi:uncharacterized protein YkwD
MRPTLAHRVWPSTVTCAVGVRSAALRRSSQRIWSRRAAVLSPGLLTLVVSASVVGGAPTSEDAAIARRPAARVDNAQIVVDVPPAPPPPPPPPASDPAAEVIALTNAARATAGLPPLTAHPQLQRAALAHSQDQAARNQMSHDGSNGSEIGDRVSAAGYPWSAVAENVAAGYSTAQAVMGGWMGSAGHRQNILYAGVVHIGVAVATSSGGTPYWTMVLAAP